MPEGPHEAFVDRVHRAVARFAETTGVEAPLVDVELADGARFVLVRLEPEPGFGMITMHVRSEHDDEGPDALIVPIGTIRRIELRRGKEEQVSHFGFAVPRDD